MNNHPFGNFISFIRIIIIDREVVDTGFFLGLIFQIHAIREYNEWAMSLKRNKQSSISVNTQLGNLYVCL